MNNPALSISVVIPVFNGERFIGRAITSVLNQSRRAHEVIVVNDGSTDCTLDVLKGFGESISVISQENAGRSIARNRGINVATGDYVAFLDADDAFLPDHLEQLAQGSENGKFDIIYDSFGDPYVSAATVPPRKPDRKRAWKHFEKYELWIVTSMVRLQFLRRSDVHFPEKIEKGEDSVFFRRLILAGASVRYVRKRGCNIGVHDGNSTADPRDTRLEHFAVTEQDVLLHGGSRTKQLLNALHKSRNHGLLMVALAHIAMDQNFRAAQYIRSMLKFATQRHMLIGDRGRALAAVCWVAVPPFRNKWFTRLIFGFFISARIALKDKQTKKDK
jgi:glycosyltransferase involved in cell wall biosynthesis